MMQNNNENAGPALPQYRVIQLNSLRHGNQPVADFDGLVTHHPIGNAQARVVSGVPVQVEDATTRSYGVIGGEIQEIETRRTDGGPASALQEDQVLLTKDFMLEDSRIVAGDRGVRDVDVPSPFAGYVNRIDSRLGAVDIYDRQGGQLVARVLHMDPINVAVGESIEYGQALGVQDMRGMRPGTGKHVHMEVDTRYYQQYENYMEDIVSGRLSIDPARQTQGIEARPVVDDGVIRIGESADIVRTVQRRLNEEGFRGADNRPLEVDGVYRLSMQAAVINYQQGRGLPQTGDIDPITLQEIAPRIYPPAVNDPHHPNGGDPPLPPYMDRYGSLPSAAPGLRTVDDPLVPQAERAVRQLEQSMGRPYTDQSACMAASVACVAKANGLSRIDHVLLSEARGGVGQSENLFVVQGEPGDPSHHRAMVKTQDAISMPVEQSLMQLQALNEDQRRHPLAQAVDEPAREVRPQMRIL